MAGATGRGRGRVRRGRGRAGRVARSPSPPSSSSSDEGCRHVHEFEFVVHITADPFGWKRLPDKFADFLDGREPAEVYLREASCGLCRWAVEMWFDGQGGMFLSTGWEVFAREHNVDVGCLVHFFYEGNDNIIVKIFDDECCRVHYHGDDSGDGSDD